MIRLSSGKVSQVVFALSFFLYQETLWAQRHVAEPAVNLGDTSFLDAIAGPGWLFEEIADGQHDRHIVDGTGMPVPGIGGVDSVTAQSHIAWLSHKRIAGGWYGMDLLDEVADVNVHTVAHTTGLGNLIVSPLILEWTGHRLLGMPLEQRVATAIVFAASPYTPTNAVNIGTNTFAVNPYYAVTLHPAKRMESSWRLHYLWNSANGAPPLTMGATSTQAGQAVHFNATASYDVHKGLWIGINAYYFSQITAGRVNGVTVPHSPERVAAMGPGAVFVTKHTFFYLNQYQEFAAQNRPTGSKLVLRVMRVF